MNHGGRPLAEPPKDARACAQEAKPMKGTRPWEDGNTRRYLKAATGFCDGEKQV